MLRERHLRVLLDSTAEFLISQDVEALQSTIHIDTYKMFEGDKASQYRRSLLLDVSCSMPK
jgi:hypothetical protein